MSLESEDRRQVNHRKGKAKRGAHYFCEPQSFLASMGEQVGGASLTAHGSKLQKEIK